MLASVPAPEERVRQSTLHEPSYTGCETSAVNLVLEGGAMRGQFTAGVLDFFIDQRFWAEHVIGTSAGALNGYNYVAGEDGRTCYLNTKYCTDWRYLSLKNFVRTGSAFGIEFAFDTIPNELEPFNYEAFSNSPMKLTTVASNLETGEADYFTFSDPRADIPYLIASSAMPLISKIVEIDGKKLLDGGPCDSVPVLYSLLSGVQKHIVVLTQHDGYIKEPNKLQALAARQYSDYPHFVERMRYRHFEYNRLYRELKRMHARGDIFLIRPPEPVTIGSMEKDPDKLFALYEQGYETAAHAWPALKHYLGDSLK